MKKDIRDAIIAELRDLRKNIIAHYCTNMYTVNLLDSLLHIGTIIL